MYISLNFKDQTFPFYQFFPQEWFVSRLYIGVSICKVKFRYTLEQGLNDFQQIENVGYALYNIGDVSLMIFYGSVDYQLASKYDQGILLSPARSVQSAVINQRAEDGYYMLYMHKLEGADENTWNSFEVSHIPSIALTELGLYSIDKILFSEPLELTYANNAYFHTLSLTTTITGLIPQINQKSLWSIGQTYHTQKKLDQSNISQ